VVRHVAALACARGSSKRDSAMSADVRRGLAELVSVSRPFSFNLLPLQGRRVFPKCVSAGTFCNSYDGAPIDG
jgi:hypothetical protein